jgi:uncharacterized damage-inducible protein DinB
MHPVRAFFDHEAWANRDVLLRCAELDLALLERQTPGTLGTIPRTMTHVVGTAQFLLALLTGQQSADPILAGEQRDLAALGPVAEDNAAGWRTLLDGSPEPDAPFGPDVHGLDRWVPLVQCIHHGDTHRAHVGSVLGAAGVQPPRIDGWGFGLTDPPDGGAVGEWADGLLVRYFDHAGWATDLVLEHCLCLGEAALGATAPGTYGTVHETLTHLVDSHGDYVRRLTGGEDDVFLEGTAEPDVLREYLERGRAGWRAYLDGGPDHERLVPSGRRAAPAWVVTLQAVHHASDHLAHVGTILGANGLPVPDADVWAYATAQAAPPAN